jgi:hypothetical protein
VKKSKHKHLRPNPQTLGVTLLEPGEESKPIRIRAMSAVFEQLVELSPKQIGELLELGLFEKSAQLARNALSRHFTLEEASALVGRKVRIAKGNMQQRTGQTITIFAVHQVRGGEGYELELADGVVVSRHSILNSERYHLLDA